MSDQVPSSPHNVVQMPSLEFIMVVRYTGLLLLFSFGLFMGWFVSRSIYNIWFHPLSKYPGPWYAATTNLVHYYFNVRGDLMLWIAAHHERHGEVVRIGPARLSFTHPQAWRDIFGHRVAGRTLAFAKDPWFYDDGGVNVEGARSIATELDDGAHARLRKIFSHAFSDRALRSQQQLLLRHADMLVERVRRDMKTEGAVDLVKLYNFATFDVIADLTFGEDLGMLRDGRYVPWVAAIFGSAKIITASMVLRRYRWLNRLFNSVKPPFLARAIRAHMRFVSERVDARVEKGSDRPDIWNLVMSRPAGERRLSRDEMYSNAGVFMVAGTETTATRLSGVTWLLLRHRAKLARLVAEVRGLGAEGALTIDNLARLRYLSACLDEAMRLYPPAPSGTPRVTPDGGAVVCGEFLPGGTRVAVPHYATYRSPKNFKDPDSFIPERWLPVSGCDRSYDTDRKDALQPFSYGPRNCLGKNLAYHELRLILAKMLWHFDLELCPGHEKWMHQKVFTLWEKPPLIVKARPLDPQGGTS